MKTEDEPELLSPCPFCKFDIPEHRLDCPSCKRNLPFCLASGKHMVLADWSKCPECTMCCNWSEMKRMLEFEPECPLCSKPVQPMAIRIADDQEAELKALSELMKDSTNEREPDEDEEAAAMI